MSHIEQLGAVLLYVFGMALVVVEVFMPGAIMGIIGLLCVLLSIGYAFYKEAYGLGGGLVALTVLSIPFLIILWVKVLRRVLAIKSTQEGTTSAMVHLKDLVGQEGVAVTQLRPAGMARIAGKKIDVVSEGPVIDRDSRIRVIEVESNRVVVQAVEG